MAKLWVQSLLEISFTSWVLFKRVTRIVKLFENIGGIKLWASLKTFVFFTSTLSLLQKRRVSGVFRDALISNQIILPL